MSANGLYVYAIIPPTVDAGSLGPGIDGTPVAVIEAAGGLAAVVHEHGTTPYQGPDSQVERWILQHSEVVERAWDQAGTVLPVSFNVIVSPGEESSTEDRLRAWLDDEAEEYLTRLQRLQGMAELRVEISLDQSVVSEQLQEIVDLRRETSQRSPGVQRLYRKRLQSREQEISEQLADRLYPDYRRRLAALVQDVAENRRVTRSEGKVLVLSASLLVSRDAIAPIGIELAAIRDERPGVEIRYLGPWPPYSFADVTEVPDDG